MKYYIGFRQHFPEEEIWKLGFFSYFLGNIGEMNYAKHREMIPYIHMNDPKIFYWQPGGMHGTFNVWDYFFVQKCDINPLEYDTVEKIKSNGWYKGPTPYNKIITNNELHENVRWVSNIIKEDIVFQSNVVDYVTKFYNHYLKNKRTLGVHIRQNQDMIKCHNIQSTVTDYINKIRELIQKYSIEKLFVITDTESIIDELRVIDYHLVHTDAFRQQNTDDLIYIDSINQRPLHRYLCGFESLTDTLLLSKCNVLLGYHSNVFDSAIYFSEAFNKSNRIAVEYIK